jgi:hypothetical protein
MSIASLPCALSTLEPQGLCLPSRAPPMPSIPPAQVAVLANLEGAHASRRPRARPTHREHTPNRSSVCVHVSLTPSSSRGFYPPSHEPPFQYSISTFLQPSESQRTLSILELAGAPFHQHSLPSFLVSRSVHASHRIGRKTCPAHRENLARARYAVIYKSHPRCSSS